MTHKKKAHGSFTQQQSIKSTLIVVLSASIREDDHMEESAFEILANSSLCKGISLEALREIEQACNAYIKSYDKGELLICLNEKIHNAGVIISGVLRLDFYDEAGNPTTIAEMGKGNVFGEAIAGAQVNSLVQVEAIEPCRIIWLDIPKMMDYGTQHGGKEVCMLMRNIIIMLSRKNVLLNSKMQMLARKRLRERIKLFLLTNAQQTSTTRQLPLGAIEKSGLARLLGVDRTTLYRELKTLSEHGVIETVDNVIYLKDRSFLEE